MKGYRKILIAMNGNRDVFDYGLKMATEEKTWVVVLKVIPPFEGDLDLTGIKDIGDVLDSGSNKATAEIDAAAKAQGALIKTRIEEGKVPEAIVEVADQEHCDVIVMGAPKRNWFSRLFGDNAVEKVIGMAPCPVFVVNG